MKILIIGHGRHGKDTLAELWKEWFGFTYKSSSERAAEIFLFDVLKEKYGYKDFMECYADRHNRRKEWKDRISEYNRSDRARLAKDILATSDGYVGMRCRREINECVRQGLFDLIVWVDACDRLPEESGGSFDIDKSIADVVVDNNGGLTDFKRRAFNLGKIIFVNKMLMNDNILAELKIKV